MQKNKSFTLLYSKHLIGFTLLELIIVTVIIGILAGLSAVRYTVMRERTLQREAEANLRLIAAAERMFRMESNANTFADCSCTTAANCGAAPPVACDNTTAYGCNNCLRLALTIQNWTYTVAAGAGVGAAATFTATATRFGGPNDTETITLDQSDSWAGTFTP